MTPLATIHSCLLALAMLFLPSQVFAQTTKSSWQEDWGKSLEAARREGRVTVSIPASASKYSRRAATPRCAGSLMSSKREYDTSIYTSAALPQWFQGCWTKASWICDWDKRPGVSAAKDRMSVKEFLQVENQSEEKPEKIREPAQKFAPALLKSV
jgi:hypothetical protein